MRRWFVALVPIDDGFSYKHSNVKWFATISGAADARADGSSNERRYHTNQWRLDGKRGRFIQVHAGAGRYAYSIIHAFHHAFRIAARAFFIHVIVWLSIANGTDAKRQFARTTRHNFDISGACRLQKHSTRCTRRQFPFVTGNKKLVSLLRTIV